MRQAIAHVALVVRDYDEAIAYFCSKLGFDLIEDTPLPGAGKRWVVVAPLGWRKAGGATLLLARAASPEQLSRAGNQTGGRVFLFLATDDFERDYRRFSDAGVEWVREPVSETYGKVAVFRDFLGNLWDLIEHAPDHPMATGVTGGFSGQ